MSVVEPALVHHAALDARLVAAVRPIRMLEAVSWPAMTMQFNAERPAILQGIAVGDTVSFTLKSATEMSVVTSIQKQ